MSKQSNSPRPHSSRTSAPIAPGSSLRASLVKRSQRNGPRNGNNTSASGVSLPKLAAKNAASLAPLPLMNTEHIEPVLEVGFCRYVQQICNYDDDKYNEVAEQALTEFMQSDAYASKFSQMMSYNHREYQRKKSRLKTVKLPVTVEERIFLKIEAWYPEYRIINPPGPPCLSGHAVSRALRAIQSAMFTNWVPKNMRIPEGYHVAVKYVGDSFIYMLLNPNTDGHSCLGFVVVKDHPRLGQGNAILASIVGKNPAETKFFNEIRANDPLRVCQNKAQNCHVTSPRIVFDHSIYDMTDVQVAHAMAVAKAEWAIGVIVWHPCIALERKGRLADRCLNWERKKKNGRETIRFFHDGDRDCYEHDWVNYLGLPFRTFTSIIDDKGEVFTYAYSMEDRRMDDLIFKITRVRADKIPRTLFTMSFHDADLSMKITLYTWVWRTRPHYSGLRSLFSKNKRHMRLVRLSLPAHLVNNLLALASSLDAAKFCVQSLYSACATFNGRIHKGGAISSVDPQMDPLNIPVLCVAVYLMIYVVRWEAVRGMTEMKNQIDASRVHNERNAVMRLMSNIYTRVTHGPVATLGDEVYGNIKTYERSSFDDEIDSWFSKVCQAMFGAKDRYPTRVVSLMPQFMTRSDELSEIIDPNHNRDKAPVYQPESFLDVITPEMRLTLLKGGDVTQEFEGPDGKCAEDTIEGTSKGVVCTPPRFSVKDLDTTTCEGNFSVIPNEGNGDCMYLSFRQAGLVTDHRERYLARLAGSKILDTMTNKVEVSRRLTDVPHEDTLLLAAREYGFNLCIHHNNTCKTTAVSGCVDAHVRVVDINTKSGLQHMTLLRPIVALPDTPSVRLASGAFVPKYERELDTDKKVDEIHEHLDRIYRPKRDDDDDKSDSKKHLVEECALKALAHPYEFITEVGVKKKNGKVDGHDDYDFRPRSAAKLVELDLRGYLSLLNTRSALVLGGGPGGDVRTLLRHSDAFVFGSTLRHERNNFSADLLSRSDRFTVLTGMHPYTCDIRDKDYQNCLVANIEYATDGAGVDLVVADASYNADTEEQKQKLVEDVYNWELLRAQTDVMINTLNAGGTFVMKCLSDSIERVLQLSNVLYNLFDTVDLVRLLVTRASGREFHFVCRGFTIGGATLSYYNNDPHDLRAQVRYFIDGLNTDRVIAKETMLKIATFGKAYAPNALYESDMADLKKKFRSLPRGTKTKPFLERPFNENPTLRTHMRLPTGKLLRERRHDFRVEDTPGDGDCFYHAVAAQIGRRGQGAMLRRELAAWIHVQHEDLAKLELFADQSFTPLDLFASVQRGDWAGEYEMALTAEMLTLEIILYNEIHYADGTLDYYAERSYPERLVETRRVVRIIHSGAAGCNPNHFKIMHVPQLSHAHSTESVVTEATILAQPGYVPVAESTSSMSVTSETAHDDFFDGVNLDAYLEGVAAAGDCRDLDGVTKIITSHPRRKGKKKPGVKVYEKAELNAYKAGHSVPLRDDESFVTAREVSASEERWLLAHMADAVQDHRAVATVDDKPKAVTDKEDVVEKSENVALVEKEQIDTAIGSQDDAVARDTQEFREAIACEALEIAETKHHTLDDAGAILKHGFGLFKSAYSNAFTGISSRKVFGPKFKETNHVRSNKLRARKWFDSSFNVAHSVNTNGKAFVQPKNWFTTKQPSETQVYVDSVVAPRMDPMQVNADDLPWRGELPAARSLKSATKLDDTEQKTKVEKIIGYSRDPEEIRSYAIEAIMEMANYAREEYGTNMAILANIANEIDHVAMISSTPENRRKILVKAAKTLATKDRSGLGMMIGDKILVRPTEIQEDYAHKYVPKSGTTPGRLVPFSEKVVAPFTLISRFTAFGFSNEKADYVFGHVPTLKTLHIADMKVTNAVPGAGKTSGLVDEAVKLEEERKRVEKLAEEVVITRPFVALMQSTDNRKTFIAKLLTRGVSPRVAENCTRTMIGAVLNIERLPKYCDLLIDEYTTHHAGDIFFVAHALKANKVHCVGDKLQTHWHTDLALFEDHYAKISDVTVTSEYKMHSYRCPQDVCDLLTPKYLAIGAPGPMTTSSKVRGATRFAHKVSDVNDIPIVPDAHYIVWTNADQSRLNDRDIDAKTLRVYQGNQNKHVIAVRLSANTADPIFEEEEFLTVALSRHTHRLDYYSALATGKFWDAVTHR